MVPLSLFTVFLPSWDQNHDLLPHLMHLSLNLSIISDFLLLLCSTRLLLCAKAINPLTLLWKSSHIRYYWLVWCFQHDFLLVPHKIKELPHLPANRSMQSLRLMVSSEIPWHASRCCYSCLSSYPYFCLVFGCPSRSLQTTPHSLVLTLLAVI